MHIYDEQRNEWIRHRDTGEYKLRKRQLRDYWTIGLLTILPLGVAVQISIIILAIFLSLSYLDETPYQSS